VLDSSIAGPIGTADTVGNFGRYRNSTVDAALNTIASTTSTAAQLPAFNQIETIFQQDMPLIPLWESQNEIEFNGNFVGNIPTVSNAYGAPAVYIQPDIGWIAARLTSASK